MKTSLTALAIFLAGQASWAQTLPPVTRLELPNGLSVLMVENHLNPYLEMRLVMRAGTGADPVGKEGLVSLAAEMMLNGTPSRSEQAVAETLESIGATLHAEAELETFELTGSVVTLSPEQRQTFLELFADVGRQASFPVESFQRSRTLRVAAVKRLATHRAALGDLALAAALYGDGPRGRSGMGYVSTLETLTRDDLVQLHERLWIPKHGVLAVGGDFDPAALTPWIERHFGDPAWGAGVTCSQGEIRGTCGQLCKDGGCVSNPFASRQPQGPLNRKVALLVDAADPSLNQVQWRMGEGAPVTLQSPEWAAFRIGAQVLGGDFTSRLNAVLRVREGLTYGARFNVDYGAWESGRAVVSTFVAPKDLGRSIVLAREQLLAVREQPLEAAEVESFRQKIVNQFPFKFETISATLEQFTWLAVAGMPASWLSNYVPALSVPGPAEIHAAMQLLDPTRMVVAAVGNRDLVPALEPFGEVWVVTAEDLLATGGEHAERQGGEPEAPAQPAKEAAKKRLPSPKNPKGGK